MFIAEVKIKGFRNFKEDTIRFKDKSLVIGQNDVGKSNLIYALRILLDRSISDMDIEPKISDFYVFEDTKELSIQVKFEQITEPCIIAKFKGAIGPNDEMYLRFNAKRDDQNNVTYNFSKAKDTQGLDDQKNIFETRNYLKALNLEYVRSNRNLERFINKEKKNLITEMMNNRGDQERLEDNQNIEIVKQDLIKVNENVRQLSYIKNATNRINNDLEELSTHNKGHKFQFSTVTESVEDIQNSVELISKINDKELCIGGDGRNNQIFMSLWCNRYTNKEKNPVSVTIYCIEEPEAHLHPHQQRQLSRFLIDTLNGQVIISTHSPQIAAEFEPGSIIRLSRVNAKSTQAANSGCSDVINQAITSFGYRMNIVASEAFFSKVVLLVEGPSECIFYKTVANKLNINMDKHGISIIDVNGVGFGEYMGLLNALNIKYVFRTDNDISKIPQKKLYRCAGIQRCIKLYRDYYNQDKVIENILKKYEKEFTNLKSKKIPADTKKIIKELSINFERIGIFLAEVDLETDIYKSKLKSQLQMHHKTAGQSATIKKMKEKKAINLYEFLKQNEKDLHKLSADKVIKPLMKCVEMSEIDE